MDSSDDVAHLLQAIKQLIEQAMSEAEDITKSKEAFGMWCRDEGARDAFDQHRAAFSKFVIQLIQYKLMAHSLAIMSHFDGQYIIIGGDGKELPTDLHSRLVGYYFDIGWE